MIVPADQVEFARSMSAAIAGLSGTGMWTAQLSASGKGPATHYVSTGYIDADFAGLMAKRGASVYRSGIRSADWVALSAQAAHEGL